MVVEKSFSVFLISKREAKLEYTHRMRRAEGQGTTFTTRIGDSL